LPGKPARAYSLPREIYGQAVKAVNRNSCTQGPDTFSAATAHDSGGLTPFPPAPREIRLLSETKISRSPRKRRLSACPLPVPWRPAFFRSTAHDSPAFGRQQNMVPGGVCPLIHPELDPNGGCLRQLLRPKVAFLAGKLGTRFCHLLGAMLSV